MRAAGAKNCAAQPGMENFSVQASGKALGNYIFLPLMVNHLGKNFVRDAEGGFGRIVPLHCQRVEGGPSARKGWQKNFLTNHQKPKTMLKYNVVPKKNPIDKTTKFYARLTPVTPIKLSALCESISSQCTVTSHDVKAVISALEEQLVYYLRNGNSVRLGDLGSFRPMIKSQGAESAEKFSPSMIQKVKIRFLGSKNFRYKLSRNHPSISFQGEEKETDVEQ